MYTFCRISGQPSDLEIILNTLNVSAMRALLEESKKNEKLWTVVGNSFVNLYAGHSCSSFAYLLLEKGGIRNLVSSYDMKYFFVKPEDIGEIAKKSPGGRRKKSGSNPNSIKTLNCRGW